MNFHFTANNMSYFAVTCLPNGKDILNVGVIENVSKLPWKVLCLNVIQSSAVIEFQYLDSMHIKRVSTRSIIQVSLNLPRLYSAL